MVDDGVSSSRNRVFARLKQVESKSELPERVNKLQISELVSATYLRFWNNSRAILESSQQ